jgi:hypothetical protein
MLHPSRRQGGISGVFRALYRFVINGSRVNMALTTAQAAQQLIVPALFWFFFIGGLCSVAVGVGLVCFSSRMFSLFDVMNRWVSFRRAFKPMAIPKDSWPFFERHRRWFALAFITASIFSIINLMWRIDMPRVVSQVSAKLHVPLSFADWIVGSMWWLMLIGGVLTTVVGVALGFFPEAMRNIEKRSNRWYSSRNVAKNADTMHTPLDKLALKYPRTLGVVIVVAAAANVIAVGNRLF